jgi:hypothetical protein
LRQTFGVGEKLAEHSGQIRQDVVVPVPNDSHALLCEPMRPAVVSLPLLLGMLSTVDFNGEPQARAIEIKCERTDGMLPSEVKAIELIATKRLP